MRRSRGEMAFAVLNALFMVLFMLSIVYPFLHLLTISLSTSTDAIREEIRLVPRQVVFDSYRKVLKSEDIWIGYGNTVIRTFFGTALSLALTSLGGYALSKRRFPHRTFWTGVVVFTMFFSGGLIPTYLLVRSLGLVDRYLAMILPGAIGAYNLIIMRNFFMTIPDSMEESARIDGTPEYRILFSIIFPLSKPMLATVGLWIIVGHWNAWFDCLIYIRSPAKFVLQVVLRRIIVEGAGLDILTMGVEDEKAVNPDTVKAAAVFVTTIPIMCIYPFLQKYFVKGVMIGALKA